jgi:hypothetical protein
MKALLLRGGQAIGLLGILLMAVSVAGRLAGRYTLGDFQVGTLMIAATGVVTVGCFLLLMALADRK